MYIWTAVISSQHRH